MKKLQADQLCVMISATCFIDADKLMMYNINTGDTKSYKDIGEDEDIGDYLIEDTIQVFTDCDELQPEEIEIEEYID